MLAKKILEKRQEINKLVTDVRAVIEKAEGEKRAITQEEKNQIEKMESDIDSLENTIELEERQLERERKFVIGSGTQEQRKDVFTPTQKNDKPRNSEEYRSAFNKFLSQGERAGFNDSEIRAMQADNAISGGLFMAPQMFVNELIHDIDNSTAIMGLARVFDINMSESLGVPTLDSDIDDASWTAEIQAASETSDLKFGTRELTPHQLAKLVKISNKLINGAVMPIESLVRERMGYKFGVTLEKAMIDGDGSQKPLGLFTPSTNGISTDQDISSGNTSTSIGADGLMDALFDMKEGYQKNATWLFHRLAVKQIRKLKDSTGQYLWQPALTGGNPATILDRPYVTSEYAPSTFSSGKYVGLVGDFKYYWVARRFALQIQVLKELYATTNQTGYIGRLEIDAMPVLPQAFRRIKLG